MYHFFSPDQPEDSCPILDPIPTCFPKIKHYCTGDSQCADGEKCCLHGDCTKRCYTLAKAGKCQKTDPKPCPAILRPPECTTDWDCTGEQKCCSDGCIKKCTSSFLTPLEGMVANSSYLEHSHTQKYFPKSSKFIWFILWFAFHNNLKVKLWLSTLAAGTFYQTNLPV